MPYPFPLKDLVGQRYGRLVVLHLLPYEGTGKGRKWLCQCDCGKQHVVRSTGLTSGQTQSCGCLYRETRTTICIDNSPAIQRKHGQRRSAEYRTWTHIKSRCLNPNVPGFKNYGARGITICDEWANSFEAFLSDMGPRPSPEHSIDRIDNDGPYAPRNCRWATSAQQTRNYRRNHLLTYQGRTQVLADWATEVGISRHTLAARIRWGWSVEDALTRPLRKDRRRQP